MAVTSVSHAIEYESINAVENVHHIVTDDKLNKNCFFFFWFSIRMD